MQVSPFAKIHKVLGKILFYFENLFLTVLLWHLEFYKNLQICLNKFGAKIQKIWSKTENKKKKNQNKKKESQPLGPVRSSSPGRNPADPLLSLPCQPDPTRQIPLPQSSPSFSGIGTANRATSPLLPLLPPEIETAPHRAPHLPPDSSPFPLWFCRKSPRGRCDISRRSTAQPPPCFGNPGGTRWPRLFFSSPLCPTWSCAPYHLLPLCWIIAKRSGRLGPKLADAHTTSGRLQSPLLEGRREVEATRGPTESRRTS
jgi:hypothetical protein